jgi:hypothetical protein
MSDGVDSVRATAIERTGAMAQDHRRPGFEAGAPGRPGQENDAGTVTIDCDDCAVRGVGCQDCVVTVLLGVPETLRMDERQALEALAEVGLAPRLRLVPIHRQRDSGVA